MKLLIKYTIFQPDNYQGGSGKAIETRALIELDGMVEVSEIYEIVNSTLSIETKRVSNGWDSKNFTISKIEAFL